MIRHRTTSLAVIALLLLHVNTSVLANSNDGPAGPTLTLRADPGSSMTIDWHTFGDSPETSRTSSREQAANFAPPAVPNAPKLVVGIVVDQMRPDYVYRYWDKFGDGGFRRLVQEGFSFTNMHFDYMPTATGPGHAGVFTGTTPSVHGVMGNSWYVRGLDRSINVIEVPGYRGIGSMPGSDEGKAPGNLLTTTVGDELRLHSNMQSRVVGISRKDRGAIMTAGHLGDAYWYEAASGNFVTSSFYHNQLPRWVREFNARNLPQQYLSEPWNTLLPIGEYTESIADANPYERLYPDQSASTFPHDLPTRVREHGMNPGLLSATPFGDKLLTELAIAAIEGESLGQRAHTDMLAIAYSATDSIGHAYGPASIEVQDAYLRLDRYLEQLIEYLEETLGEDEFVLFLTSDHGVVHVPQYLVDQGIPGGYFDSGNVFAALSAHLESLYGEDLVRGYSNYEIFLDNERIVELGYDPLLIQREVARFMLHIDGVGGALTAEALNNTEFTDGIREIVQNGFHQKRSGDVMIWLEPQTIPNRATGTTHGSPWTYDRHAPMHWYGKNIPAGSSAAPVFIRDIASTISMLLRSPLPSGNTGNPMNDHMLP